MSYSQINDRSNNTFTYDYKKNSAVFLLLQATIIDD